MKQTVPKNLTHRGTVSAEGFLFSAKLLSEQEMRRRILSLWQPQAKVFRCPNGLIFLAPQSFRVDCRCAVGLPLVRLGNFLAGFPVREKDAIFFENFGETIIFSEAGEIRQFAFTDLKAEAVEDWFDVSMFRIVKTATLGEPATQPVAVAKIENLNLRKKLNVVPQADEKLSEILQILKQKRAEIERAEKSGRQPGVLQTSYGNVSSRLFGGLFDSLKNLFSSKSSGGHGWHNLEPDKPKLPGRLKKMFTKAMFQMKIAQLIGREQAKYLAKMMEMFENGDLDEALKYAVPLEDMQSLKEMSESLPSFSFLRPRNNLQINFGKQTSASSAVHLEQNWFAELQTLYRRSFERLVAQNRVEEAAFVLAELLNSNSEAVEFLERNGKYRLAAELAESRNLPKETIVRQWFLAGETRRAVQIAVLHNCFGYVVTQLEKQNHPQAAELRGIWAENVAASGNYAEAISVIWHLADKREKACDWLEKIIEFGGVNAAQMLAKKISLFPEDFANVKEKAQDFLTANSLEAKEKRSAFAGEILRLKKSPELEMFARLLIRKLLSDIAAGSPFFSLKDFNRLVEYARDYSLRTDLPQITLEEIAEKSDPLYLTVAENDRGSTAVYDAHLLPDAKIVVALGEAGVKILSETGKTIAHFDQPTEQFAVSDFGTNAICLMRRGKSRRLAKIDFVGRKAVYWCSAIFTKHAEDFDGNIWFIGNEDELHAIDTTAADFESVWRIAEIGGEIYEVSRSSANLMLLIFTQISFEKWQYDLLPNITLRSRNETNLFRTDSQSQKFLSVASSAAYSVLQIFDTEKFIFTVKVFDYDTQIGKFDLPDDTLDVAFPKVIENKYLIERECETGKVIELYETPNVKLAEINLPATGSVNTRLNRQNLIVTDEFGRVIIFDHKIGVLRKNIRV